MERNIKNRSIFCKDNLDILRGINSNCVDLIYLDPPFNKNKVFSAPIGSSAEGADFPDIFREEDVKDEWLQSIKEDYDGLYHFLDGVKNLSNIVSDRKNKHYLYNYCYLAYMAMRLIECQRILKDTGSVYLHCDPTMSHYLKILLDIIFGEKNFRNEIVWCYSKWRNEASRFPQNHDILFFYSKNKISNFNHQYQDKMNDDKIRDLKRGYHSQGKKLLVYDDKKPMAIQKIQSGVYEKIVYIKEKNLKGTILPDYWNIPSLRSSKNKENKKYPTQKPLKLLERIIKASSNEGDFILDPFCGCATTCVAAEKLGRKWAGIDVSVMAYDFVRERIKEEVDGTFDFTKKNNPREAIKINYSTTAPKRTDGDADVQIQKYVYVISNPAFQNMYKVGIAKNYTSRLNSYQTSDPDRNYKLEYKILTPNFRPLEKYIHEKFNNKHEWVRGDLNEIITAIENFKPNKK